MGHNQLAELQKGLLEEGLDELEYLRRKSIFLESYYKMRLRNENRLFGRLSPRTRKKLHPIILAVYRIKNKLGGFTFDVLVDDRKPTFLPIIFAITHVGKYDIEVISAAIKEHYYLLSGDYEHIQGIIDEPFLALNGVVYFNEFVKDDRRKATKTMIKHLRNGGNLMYFPEGTWNLTPNLPVLPCFWGIVDIAKAGNAIIVPVAADQYGKHFKICIGNNISMQSYGDSADEKSRAISDIRDAMAELKWRIWESEPIQTRLGMNERAWDQYVNERFSEWPYFNHAYISRLIFRPKDKQTNQPIASCTEAFEHLRSIQPSNSTAFLFNKRLTGIAPWQ